MIIKSCKYVNQIEVEKFINFNDLLSIYILMNNVFNLNLEQMYIKSDERWL